MKAETSVFPDAPKSVFMDGVSPQTTVSVKGAGGVMTVPAFVMRCTGAQTVVRSANVRTKASVMLYLVYVSALLDTQEHTARTPVQRNTLD